MNDPNPAEQPIDLWLDDTRPSPPGWVHVKSIDEAKILLAQRIVRQASLDHDLGACDECLAGHTPAQWFMESGFRNMPNCEHVGTGYNLVSWMSEAGHWPLNRPSVHSRNVYGKKKMEALIQLHWGGRTSEELRSPTPPQRHGEF